MKPTSHTPGPWTIEHIPGLDFGASVEIMAGKTVIAQVWKTDDAILRWSNDEAGQANARLFIAAPGLLEAARELVRRIERDNLHTTHGVQLSPLRDAIAKAVSG